MYIIIILIYNTRKENTVLNRLHIVRKEEIPVCVACNAVISVEHILMECADLLEIRKKYFKERSLDSLFQNTQIFLKISCKRLVCFIKYEQIPRYHLFGNVTALVFPSNYTNGG